MKKRQHIKLREHWHVLWLIIIFSMAFLVGGASREALNWHLCLHALGWFGAALIVLLKYELLLKTTPKLPIFLFMLLSLWCWVTLLPLPADWFVEKHIYKNLIAERKNLGSNENLVTISLSPVGTLRSLLSFGPSLYILLCIPLLNEGQRSRGLYGVLLLGVISIVLGLGQIFTGRASALYFWDFTNRGFAVGIFANTNHQTIFAAVLIPIVYAIGLQNISRFKHGEERFGYAAIFAILCLLIFIGVIVGGSAAGYGLSVFALIASIIFLRTSKVRSLLKNVSFSVVAFAAIFLLAKFIALSPRLYGLGTYSYGGGEESRKSINIKGLRILEENYMFGTGYGSFTEVYPFYENTKMVTNRFVNHAHNDWLEWMIELGLPGFVLLVIFGGWLSLKYIKLFLTQRQNSKEFLLCKVTAICSMILLIHSFVDYPLRTPFLQILFWALIAVSVTMPYTKKVF